jgi:hypothetical protein
MSLFVSLPISFVCLKTMAMTHTKTKTANVRTAKAKSLGTFFKPNLAITDVKPAKKAEASAYRIQVGIVVGLVSKKF